LQDEVDLGFELKFETLCSGLFMRRVVEEARHQWVGIKEWTTDESSLLDTLERVEGVEPIVRKKDTDTEACVFYLKGVLAYLQLWRSQVVLRVAGPKEHALLVEEQAKKLLPEAALMSRVQVRFWYWASRRGFAMSLQRLLSVPRWDGIVANYPRRTREPLDRLIREGLQPSSGQLVIWFGEPGCGKTYALRALLREWRDRFSLHYISDTESFFANGEYMLSVLLNEDVDNWKLFILEDVGRVPLARCSAADGSGAVATPERLRRPNRAGPEKHVPYHYQRTAFEASSSRLSAWAMRRAARIRRIRCHRGPRVA